MKFRIIAKEGYIVIADGRRRVFVGCEFADDVARAFRLAERMNRREGILVTEVENGKV